MRRSGFGAAFSFVPVPRSGAILDRFGTIRHIALCRGAVAQLGERVVRNDEVVGSIPIGSTNSPNV